jgi:hypothetical protein
VEGEVVVAAAVVVLKGIARMGFECSTQLLMGLPLT